MQNFLSADFLKFALPLVGAVFAWLWERRQRRALDEYQRKEERYRELLLAVPGFYVPTQSPEFKQSFLNQVNLCWLYCSDDVIRKAYAFLVTVHTDARSSDKDKEKALGELIVSIRKDLLARRIVSHTQLKAEDFKNLAST